MQNNRRNFLRWAGWLSMGLAGAGFRSKFNAQAATKNTMTDPLPVGAPNDKILSMIGLYGPWAAKRLNRALPSFSFRRPEWQHLSDWQQAATKRLKERLAIPELGKLPAVTTKKQYTSDGLHIEEISWQLPYGRPTEAILIRPVQATRPLPGILAFHDHGGNKYFGTPKITHIPGKQHPAMAEHQQQYYGGRAWANEIAKRGYVVLVSDAFTFGSRRVQIQDVPESLRHGLTDQEPEKPENIKAYNQWASDHESVMAKSLFSGGTTWPAVFFAEDQMALEVLCARQDVDANRIGCGGLSGGGLRTVLLAALDSRIKCAIPVGFMTTWQDFLLHKSFTHTWMTYIPLLPKELDFPEILSLRAPLPTLVLNNTHDTLFTLAEMQQADKILAEVYQKAGAANHYACTFHPGPHKFDRKMQQEAFSWFDRWLQN